MSHHGRNVPSPQSKIRAKAHQAVNPNELKVSHPSDVVPTDPHPKEIAMTEVNRGVNAGAGKHRGDRRDMNRTYTTTQKHAARGNNPRKDVSTRAR